MIFATLQNYLKRLYLFPLLQNSVIRFQNKSLGSELKTHLFPDLFSFETQRCKSSLKKCAWSLKLYIFEKKCALSLELNGFMGIIESKKVRLEFEICIVEFLTPGDAHF